MITLRLSGGLGNQMFQYAMGLTLSLNNKAPLSIDLSSFHHDKKRRYELSCFNIAPKFINPINFYTYKFLKRIIPTSVLNRTIFFPPYNNQIIKEKSFSFDSSVQNIKEGYLDGYWQSEKYFQTHSIIVRKAFSFKDKMTKENVRLAEIINSSDSISVHIRRGDYISDLTIKGIYANCPLNYYDEAINYTTQDLRNPALFIFSDDIIWAKKNIKTRFNRHFVDINNAEASYNDMRLMSLCKHNIIANSSFSWWGAWLNTNPQKKIVAPKTWFTDTSIPTIDLIPDSWIKL